MGDALVVNGPTFGGCLCDVLASDAEESIDQDHGEQRVFAVEHIGFGACEDLEIAVKCFAEADAEVNAVRRRFSPELASQMDAVRVGEAFIAFFLVAPTILFDGVPHFLRLLFLFLLFVG